ncbi:MAG: hypothetical protein WAM92_06935, partial [Mycobacterium sp.]
YPGGSDFARWWRLGIAEVAQRMLDEGGANRQRLDEFFELNDDPAYWTWTICFTAASAQRPALS